MAPAPLAPETKEIEGFGLGHRMHTKEKCTGKGYLTQTIDDGTVVCRFPEHLPHFPVLETILVTPTSLISALHSSPMQSTSVEQMRLTRRARVPGGVVALVPPSHDAPTTVVHRRRVRIRLAIFS